MPKQLELRAEPRSVVGKKVKRLRKGGLVPANIYGHGESRPIQATERAMDQLIIDGGRGGLVSIVFDGGEPETAMLKSLTRDPVSGRIQHVDFQAVSLNERVSATVPLRFVGEAPAARAGGVVFHPATEVKVEGIARRLPDVIEVDLSTLEEFGAGIRMGDLSVPQGFDIVSPHEELVALVQAPKVAVEEVEEAAAEEAVAATDREEAELPAAETAEESTEPRGEATPREAE